MDLDLNAVIAALTDAKAALEEAEAKLTASASPDPSPAHEALESPEEEGEEHATGAEALDGDEEKKRKGFPFGR